MLRLVLFFALTSLGFVQAAQEKGVLDVAPTLVELGDGWTTYQIAYLLDPRSQPFEIDFYNRKPSPILEFHREQMKKDGRTGYATLLYGRGDMAMNKGLYRVYIQRWGDTRSLHNRWVDWKMTPTRVVRSGSAVGEDCFWSDDGMFQEFTFRRGLFHVVIQTGSTADYEPTLRLAEVIDAKIRDSRFRGPM